MYGKEKEKELTIDGGYGSRIEKIRGSQNSIN